MGRPKGSKNKDGTTPALAAEQPTKASVVKKGRRQGATAESVSSGAALSTIIGALDPLAPKERERVLRSVDAFISEKSA